MRIREIARANAKKKQWYAKIDVESGEITEVDNIRPDNSRAVYVKVEGTGYRNIVNAFGGFVCHTSLKSVIGKVADAVIPDETKDNPNFKSSGKMRLYLRKRVDAIIKNSLNDFSRK